MSWPVTPLYPGRTIDGAPGTTWTNNTGQIRYQLRVNWDNSCGRCIQYSNRIGPWWPVPMHPRCRCRNVPVLPGEQAAPFLDFQAELMKLDPADRGRVIGKYSLALVVAGKADWKDVVTPMRIRPLADVVRERKLTPADLRSIGMPAKIIERLTTRTPGQQSVDRAFRETIDRLREQGIKDDAISARVGAAAAARAGAVLVTPPRMPPPPDTRPRPAPVAPRRPPPAPRAAAIPEPIPEKLILRLGLDPGALELIPTYAGGFDDAGTDEDDPGDGPLY